MRCRLSRGVNRSSGHVGLWGKGKVSMCSLRTLQVMGSSGHVGLLWGEKGEVSMWQPASGAAGWLRGKHGLGGGGASELRGL